MALLDQFKTLLLPYSSQAKHFWIAYSGGGDSNLLLFLFKTLRDQGILTIPFTAVYINHGLQEASNEWETRCAKQCAVWNIPFQSKRLHLKIKHKESIESVAREQRYAAFAELVQEREYVVTGHHADDQAETVLVQLLRGAGPKGLSGMPEKAILGKGFLWRPLLSFSKKILHEYALVQQIEWIEDPSNDDIRFTRNFLRHSVMPLLKERWPTVELTLSRAAQHCAAAEKIIDEVVLQDLLAVKAQDNTLIIEELKKRSVERQKQAIRGWIKTLGLSQPATIHVQRIIDEMLGARLDAAPLVEWEGAQIRRYAGKLFGMHPLEVFDNNQRIQWNNYPQPLVLPGDLGILNANPKCPLHPLLLTQQGEIRFRQGGEVFQVPSRTHHISLKKWFQEQGIPPWLRDRVPLLFIGNELHGTFSIFK